jgi:hypothetical protein
MSIFGYFGCVMRDFASNKKIHIVAFSFLFTVDFADED